MYGDRRCVYADSSESKWVDLAVADIRDSIGLCGECQSTELGDYGRVLWPAVFRHPPGLATSSRPANVHEHTSMDGLDL